MDLCISLRSLPSLETTPVVRDASFHVRTMRWEDKSDNLEYICTRACCVKLMQRIRDGIQTKIILTVYTKNESFNQLFYLKKKKIK